MKIFNPIIKALTPVTREILGIFDWLGDLALQPVVEIKRRIEARSNKENEVEQESPKSLLLLPFRALKGLFSLVRQILFSPLDLAADLIQRKTVLWSLAGCSVLAIAIATGVSVYRNSDSYKEAQISQFRKLAPASFRNGSFDEAAEQYDQLTALGSAYESETLNRAIAHANIGNQEKSLEILESIAPGPGNTPGYDKAHQVIAASIFRQIKSTKLTGPQVWETLRWHLSCSGDDLPGELQVVWAEYYLSVREPDKAIRYVKAAADQIPEALVLLANIYQQQGKQTERTETLEKAADAYKKLVADDDTNVENRIKYSRILFDLERYAAAQKTLLDGQKLDSKELQTATASLYVSRYKVEIHQNGLLSAADTLELLQEALSHDDNYLPAYQSFIEFYRLSRNTNDRKFILNSLKNILRSNTESGFAHFALGNIYLIENELEKSQVHMEQAFKANSSLPFIANNLAWMLAHDEKPDFERAHSIAAQIVDQNPNDGRFRDTLATILMMQKDYLLALTEFQKALPTANNKSEIHEKMATIYRKLNKVELAIHHEEQAVAN